MKMLPVSNNRLQAKIDDRDFMRLSLRAWHENQNGYVECKLPGGKRELLHRAVLGAPPSLTAMADHINGDRLDNRRQNLRWVTVTQNNQNARPRSQKFASPFKGVSFDRGRRKWVALIRYAGKQHKLGRFEMEHDAARAYDRAAPDAFKEFAVTNEALAAFAKHPNRAASEFNPGNNPEHMMSACEDEVHHVTLAVMAHPIANQSRM